jgi:chondroitin 4-sulfotransferase 11
MALSTQLLSVRQRLADWRGRGVYSHYADQHQCIFIHIPKAAGTSVALTLFDRNSRHVPWHEYYSANPHKFARYYKFTFVRNPWDRLVSSYMFLQKGGMNDADARWAARYLKPFASFEDFVLDGIQQPEIHSWVHFLPQSHFVCDVHGKCQMDFVGKFENLADDFAVVAAKLGCQRQLAKVNVGQRDHYRQYYSEATRAKVAQVYTRDIACFGYEF